MAKSSNHIAVVDYGMGNLHSVSKALQKVSEGAKISVSGDKKVLSSADRIVFPGVGAIRDCMAEIKRRSLDVLIEEAIRTVREKNKRKRGTRPVKSGRMKLR